MLDMHPADNRPPSQPLDYQNSQDVPKWRRRARKLIVTCSLLFALSLLIAATVIGIWYWSYTAPERELRNHLRSLPGVLAVEIKSLDDMPTVQILSGTITLTGNRQEIELQSPYVECMRDGSHLSIRRIGPYLLRATDDARRQGSVNVGSKGAFHNWLPSPIRDAKDLVARYDEILNLVKSSKGVSTHVGSDGRIYKLEIDDERGL